MNNSPLCITVLLVEKLWLLDPNINDTNPYPSVQHSKSASALCFGALLHLLSGVSKVSLDLSSENFSSSYPTFANSCGCTKLQPLKKFVFPVIPWPVIRSSEFVFCCPKPASLTCIALLRWPDSYQLPARSNVWSEQHSLSTQCE